jgi:hypothetical protein
MVYDLSASAVLPGTTITYTLISGNLPPGLSMSGDGIITGLPGLVVVDTTSIFTVRATDNLNNLRDRTFSIRISGVAIPQFTTPEGLLVSTQDSIWIEIPIQYSNPDNSNVTRVELKEGLLPPGLEINESGIIRGYPEPPINGVTLPTVTTSATTTDTSNSITCLSTVGFTVGRPVLFSGTTFGGLTTTLTYYVKGVINATSFTVSTTQNGPVYNLNNDTGYMLVTLPSVSAGQPTIRTYAFVLELISPLGGDTSAYSITVINQNTPVSQSGPGNLPNTRVPSILNTRPQTFIINPANAYYGYYIIPSPESDNLTTPPASPAFIGTILSGNYFAFKIIGYDFDGSNLTYSFSGLPIGLTGDSSTGWITGTPTLTSTGISQFIFSVATYKATNPSLISAYYNFSYNLTNDINGVVTWVTPSNLGTVFNGTISTLSVSAISDVDLSYRVTNGILPPNLVLLDNGEITGYVANQPTTSVLNQGDTTEFTFTIEAYSLLYPVVLSSRTFTVTVLQQYNQPTDILYIKAAPSISDRVIIDTLLDNESLIPTTDLYRPSDVYFGKASSVIYEHAYGIYASDIDEYIASVSKNHYWRNITLGEIKTAVAKNDVGEIIYEVVYSEVVDNLVNSKGISIQKEIYWPRPIDLGLGPWYTSLTDIYTSYVDILGQQYYTSLTPGYARILYPNSLPNMRNQVASVLGQEYDSTLLPLWMTSQQPNGSTLGYTQAWVICYTKPGKAAAIQSNIQNNWKDPIGRNYVLNQINFRIDRFSVDKSITYNYDKSTTPPAWTGLPSASPVPNPLDSKDFYVLFPRQTILPDNTQY